MKNETTRNTVISVITVLIGVAALACIIASMVTDEVRPYLTMGLGLGVIGNAVRMAAVRGKKGKSDGSSEDGRVS